MTGCRRTAEHHCIGVFILIVYLGLTLTGASPNRDMIDITAEERSWLDNHPDLLTLYYNIEFPPIEFQSVLGTFTGMGADIISRLEEILGISFIMIPSDNWVDHLAALKRGDCAVAPTIVKTPDREEYSFFTTPYATAPVVIITTNTFTERLSLEDMGGWRVGVVSGYATELYMQDQALLHSFQVLSLANVQEGLEMVSFGEIDAFVENIAVAAYYIELMGIPNLRVAGETDYSFSWSIGVSRIYPLLYSSLQKALSHLSEEELLVIRKKWISLESDYGMSPTTRRQLKLAAVFTILLIAGLTGFSLLLKHRLDKKVIALRESENRYRRLTENSPAVVFQFQMATDGSFSFPFISKSLNELCSLSHLDAMADSSLLLSRIHPEDRASFRESILASAETLKPYHAVFRMYNLEEYRWVETYSTPERLENGGTLWDGFSMDITPRKEAEQILLESEERFFTAFNSSPAPMSISEIITGRLISVNEQFLAMVGYRKEEIIGRTSLEIGIWENPKDRLCMLSIHQDGGLIRGYPTRFVTKTGEVRDVLISIEIIKISGETVLLAFFLDITDQKNVEAALRNRLSENEILLHEIHHRVKNSLTVISSLLNLQASSIKSPEEAMKAFKESQDRIMAMALIYEKLYESKDCAAIDLKEYLLDLTNQIVFAHHQVGKIQIRTQTDGVHLGVNVAIPIGLILNELITNALLHAFPDGRPGTITVSISEQNNEEYLLSVTDDGVGFVYDQSEQRSIGLTMVHLLSDQLEGTLSSEVRNGTIFSLRFPRRFT